MKRMYTEQVCNVLRRMLELVDILPEVTAREFLQPDFDVMFLTLKGNDNLAIVWQDSDGAIGCIPEWDNDSAVQQRWIDTGHPMLCRDTGDDYVLCNLQGDIEETE